MNQGFNQSHNSQFPPLPTAPGNNNNSSLNNMYPNNQPTRNSPIHNITAPPMMRASSQGMDANNYYNNFSGLPSEKPPQQPSHNGMSNVPNSNNYQPSNTAGPNYYPPVNNAGQFRATTNADTPIRPENSAPNWPSQPPHPYQPVHKPVGPPLLSGHPYQPTNMKTGPPPIASQSNQPHQKNVGPPPLPGQPYKPPQKTVGPPPLSGQPYHQPQNSFGAPPLSHQPPSSSAGPPQSSAEQHTLAGPPPQNNLGPPPSNIPQTNTEPPSLHHQTPHFGTGPPLNTAPPLHAGPPIASGPPLPGSEYPPPQQNVRPPPLPNQPYQGNQKNINSDHAPPPGQIGPAPNSQANLNYPGQMPMGINRGLGNLSLRDMSEDQPINLMQGNRVLPKEKDVELPVSYETVGNVGRLVPPNRKNCHPDVMRCTLKSIPNSQTLLSKVKLPFGLIIHPFKDLSSLPVITAGSIVRCRRCRTYINPFVTFLEERRWRCNMCYAVNDTPEEFLHHPVHKTYGEPHTRPECTNSTIEFIAPQEYMLRPPQPAVYLILLDVSHSAIETGYLQVVCDVLLENLDQLPGDKRTLIGFLSYNRTIHFYRLSEGSAQPQMIVVSDVDDVFIPTYENLLVNLHDKKDCVTELLKQLPKIHTNDNFSEEDTYSALGAALEVATKLMAPYGGRISVFQQSIPCIGPGKLASREDPNTRASSKVDKAMINPATDFYKKMALDCSANQVAIDFFFLNSQYVDIATLSCASRFSAGDIHHYPGLHFQHNPMQIERFSRDLDRYFSRKIGFESVMRIRCSKGLSFHSFHGNFFVRSTDLLSLANINPDAGYAVNVNIDDPITDVSNVCFQAALLYTSSKGERRIRIHTLCFPLVKTAKEVIENVDCAAAVCLLSKMAVDRAVTSSLQDSREAITNALVDLLKVYREYSRERGLPLSNNGVYVPPCLKLFPLYIHCLLKHPSIRTGLSTRLDDRVFAMIELKIQPATFLMQSIHPDLYRVDDLEELSDDTDKLPMPELLPLSAEYISSRGCYLLDCGWVMYLLVGRHTSAEFINDVLDAPQFSNIPEPMYSVPELENNRSKTFISLVENLQDNRPHHAPLRVIRDDVRERHLFMSRLHQDRTESSTSLQEFLLFISQRISS